MKKLLMVIFVLSLLGLLATPVLASALAETGPYIEMAGARGGGGFRLAGGDKPVQVAKRGFWLPVEPPYYAPQSVPWTG